MVDRALGDVTRSRLVVCGTETCGCHLLRLRARLSSAGVVTAAAPPPPTAPDADIKLPQMKRFWFCLDRLLQEFQVVGGVELLEVPQGVQPLPFDGSAVLTPRTSGTKNSTIPLWLSCCTSVRTNLGFRCRLPSRQLTAPMDSRNQSSPKGISHLCSSDTPSQLELL